MGGAVSPTGAAALLIVVWLQQARIEKTCSILPSGAGFFEAFLISEIRKIPLTLAELGCSTSLLQSVLLSFLHTRVSCQEAGCLQGRTVLVIVNLAECS